MPEALGNPEEFDLDAWCLDAKRPERSLRIYKRADLQGRLDELERQMADSRRAAYDEPSLGDEYGDLEEEYVRVAQEFKDSGILVTVQGLLGEELDAINEAATKAKESTAAKGRRMIAKALVSPKLTIQQLEKLEQSIGSAQIGLIAIKVNEATNQAPVVTIPFSRTSSGQDAGEE